MSMWRNVWFIVAVDLKRAKWGLVISTIMYAYFGVFSSFIVNELYPDALEAASRSTSFLADIMFLCSLSCIGFIMTGEYRNYWRSDIFSKRLLYMRSLPIAAKELVLVRYVHIAINLLYLSLIFFVPFYFLSVLGERFTILEYLSFALIWLCFGACMSIVFAHKELGGTGKAYLWFSVISVAVYFAASGAAAYAGFGFVSASVEAAKRYGPLVPCVGLILSAGWAYVWSRWTSERISRRDFGR